MSDFGQNLWWKDHPYVFRPKRDLTLPEVNMLLKEILKMKAWDEESYENLPDELKEHFEEREDG